MANIKLTNLPVLSAPATGDKFYGVDVSDTTDSADGTSKQVELSYLIALAGYPFRARISASSTLPVTVSDVTGFTSIYLHPFQGNAITLYNTTTSSWQLYTLSAPFQKALGTLTSGLNYDVFVSYSSGFVVTLTAWTNDTTRATALTTQDGILVKTGALDQRYAGTIRTTSTTAIEDSKAKRFVWNYYNRVEYKDFTNDTTDSFTETGNGTWSAMNGGNAAWKYELIIGYQEDAIVAEVLITANDGYAVAIAMDSATTPDRTKGSFGSSATSTYPFTAKFCDTPAVGYHYVQALESTWKAGTYTAYGDNGATFGAGTNAMNSGFHRMGHK